MQRTGEPLRVFTDIVVFFDAPEETGKERLARLDAQAGAEYRSDALTFTGTALSWQIFCSGGSSWESTASGCGRASSWTTSTRSQVSWYLNCSDAAYSAPSIRRRIFADCLAYPSTFPTATPPVLRPPDRRGIHFHEFSEA